MTLRHPAVGCRHLAITPGAKVFEVRGQPPSRFVIHRHGHRPDRSWL